MKKNYLPKYILFYKKWGEDRYDFFTSKKVLHYFIESEKECFPNLFQAYVCFKIKRLKRLDLTKGKQK